MTHTKDFYCPECHWEGNYKDASPRMYTWTLFCPECGNNYTIHGHRIQTPLKENQ